MRRPLALFAALALTACHDRAHDAPPAPRAHAREEATVGSPTEGALGPVAGDGPLQHSIRDTQRAAREHPQDARRLLDLATLFVRLARESEDASYYLQADDAVQRALRIDPQNTEAQQLRGLVLLQDHRFRDARDLARAQLARAQPHAETYGILSDALLELGDYPGAVDAAQHMVDLHPDSQSYVRAAWLRWIHGDVDGADEVMRLALDSLPRDPAARAWIVTQMGVLQWNRGDLDGAQRWYEAATREDPTFSGAHAGLARIALARHDAPRAATEALAAVHANPIAEHEWLAGDALTAAGRASDAAEHYASLDRIGTRTDPRTLSLYLSTTDRDAARAVELARREYQNRQDLFSDDALAWALFRAHQVPEAREAITRALRTDIRDARILYHAGAIAHAAGDDALARTRLTAALAQNPAWHPSEPDDARRVLAALGTPPPATAAR